MEGYIVSNVATRDAPLKPRALARRQDVQHASGITPAFRRQLRDEIIAATPEQIRALSEPLAEATGRFATCVLGGRDQIAASDADLSVVELFGSGAQS
jgi:Zn-dependent M16 (insulinase) family peptidase